MTANYPELIITKPSPDSLVSLTSLDLEVKVFLRKRHMNYKELQPVLGRHPVNIYLDNRLVGMAKRVLGKIKGEKATYVAKIDLSKLTEGTHSLSVAMQLKNVKSNRKKIIPTASVNFTLDKTPPLIRSVFPSDATKIEDRFFSRVIVEAVDIVSGLNPPKCVAVVGGRRIENPTVNKNCLVFLVPETPIGIHELNITVIDNAGHSSTSDSHFEIIGSTKAEEDEYWLGVKNRLNERLSWDKKFQRLVFTDARAAFAEAGVPYTKTASMILPPALPEAQAEFFTSVDREAAAVAMEQLTARVTEALAKRDNARIARVLERLGTSEIVLPDGSLSANAIDTVSQMLQNPLGLLEDLGVTPTEEEKKYICPSFPGQTADAFAEWLSMSFSGKLPEPSPERQENFKDTAKEVTLDADLLYRFLTNPKGTYLEFFPDAAPRDLEALPEPLSDEEANKIINAQPDPPPPPATESYHNSSDMVVGFSFALMNKFIDLFFTTVGGLPLDIGPTTTTVTYLGVPTDIVTEIHIGQPGNIQVVNAATNTVSLTGSGNGSLSIGPQQYTCAFVFTPVYDIVLNNNRIYLRFNRLDVQVTLTGMPDAAAISQQVEDIIRANYPTDDIYLAEQKPVDVNMPFADVAVRFDRILIYDDQDSFGSGELYFSIGVDDKEHQFGQFDANSGYVINLAHPGLENNLFRLSKNGGQFLVSVRGKDRDLGMWPDEDDDLGSARIIHSASAPGRYALTAQIPVMMFELISIFIQILLFILCWLIFIIATILNACGRVMGFRNQLTWKCQSWFSWVERWFPKSWYQDQTTYVLEYEIIPINPVQVTINQTKCFTANNALYLGFDFIIPGIPDKKSKTVADNFLGTSDFGFAVSENLLNKTINAWWKYSSIARRHSTSVDSRAFYAHIDLYNPDISIVTHQNSLMAQFMGLPAPYHIFLQMGLSGQAGSNLGFIHMPLGCPNHTFVYSSVRLDQLKLILTITKFWFSGSNPTTNILNTLAWFYNGLGFISGGQTSLPIVADLEPEIRTGIRTSEFTAQSSMTVGSSEVTAGFSIVIQPVISVDTTALNYVFETEKTVTIKNTGIAVLKVTALLIDDPVFSIRNFPALPLRILPSREATLIVQIAPGWTGMHAGRLTIDSNDLTQSSMGIALTAKDIPQIGVTPKQLVFNNIIGTNALVTISNSGHGTLTVNSVNSNNSYFVVSGLPGFPFQILPLQQQTLTIDFTGTGSGDAAVEIHSDDPDQSVVIVRAYASFDNIPINIGMSSGPY